MNEHTHQYKGMQIQAGMKVASHSSVHTASSAKQLLCHTAYERKNNLSFVNICCYTGSDTCKFDLELDKLSSTLLLIFNISGNDWD
jgi:hypothetical protein